MDLKSGYPFWAVKNGLMHPFQKLDADLQCDVAIIGAGITGSLIADELAAHGHSVAVFDQRDVAWGSTSANTALLQYEIDTHMTELTGHYGEAEAAKAYLACRDAIDQLEHKARDIGKVDFANMRWLEADEVRGESSFAAPWSGSPRGRISTCAPPGTIAC